MQIINGIDLKKAIVNAAAHLERNRDAVDDLNVFPVPDGDTGTNMSLTLSAAARDLLAEGDNPDLGAVAKAVASSSLRGARGNSGVILSQILRGFSRGLEGKTEADVKVLSEACTLAAQTAYKAVMKPTEGTILTVAKDTAKAAVKAAEKTNDIETWLGQMCQAAEKSLNRTPELLPVLKKAGVVDAGGMGLLVILKGMTGEAGEGAAEQILSGSKPAASRQPQEALDTEDIRFQYCTEFIILKHSESTSTMNFRASIENKGDSMLVIDDGDVAKVHIHTNHPGYVLEQAVKIGQLTSIKIDNMKEQHREVLSMKKEPDKKYGMVAVASGDGLSRILQDLNVDEIVAGGQSMNPSTEDILAAAEKISAETIFIFPNNKNIILAAEQAQQISEQNLVVIPSKTIPQGIGAMLAFDGEADVETNRAAMTEAIAGVRTGQVTYAARNSNYDDQEIAEGDILGLCESNIIAVGRGVEEIAAQVASQLVDEETAVLTLFYGADADPAAAEKLKDELEQSLSCDVFLHYGGQPLYYYILSAE